MVTIGEKMRYIRLINGKMQNDIAPHLNTTNASISRYENNIRVPKSDYVKRFADYFEIDVNFLYGKVEDPQLKTNAVMIEAEKLARELYAKNDVEKNVYNLIGKCYESFVFLEIAELELIKMDTDKKLNIGNVTEKDLKDQKDTIKIHLNVLEDKIINVLKYFEY